MALDIVLYPGCTVGIATAEQVYGMTEYLWIHCREQR